MAQASAAWMPLYVGDYLGDTQRLTTEQHGAYLLLILDYWRNGPAPDDDAVLQQITKLERGAWKRHRPALARMFQVADGLWKHKRIDRELESAAENADRRASKARAAAEARWGNARTSHDDAPSNAPRMPEAMPVECPPQSPSPNDVDASHPHHSRNKRGKRISVDWLPGPLPGSVADLVAQWPLGREQRELEGFVSYWLTRSRDAARLDWDLTWHNRIRDQHDRVMREANHANRQNGRSAGGDNAESAIFAARRNLGFDR